MKTRSTPRFSGFMSGRGSRTGATRRRALRCALLAAGLAAALSGCGSSPEPGETTGGGSPPVTPQVDAGAPAACIEAQVDYVKTLVPQGGALSAAEAVKAVLAHPEFRSEMPYCSGDRP